ncbi:cytidine deaminase family protein [Streptomyces hokutonensis]|uniref:cytidine deaminase family protein n=1 Tax=Streptomyces hokutonensis TaxID=1306990 RepID=UPI00368B6D15
MVAMKLSASARRVVEAAERLAATLGNDPNHTVAAAAMDTAGRIHEAVNVYHFTGGPCAELVALGVAATAGAGPLVTIAAAGDRGRGLIPPCGRCRQALLDLHPDVQVAVPTDDGPALRPIRKLLADTYFFPDADACRIVRFEGHDDYEAVATARKTSTVRHDETIGVGPAIFFFEGDETHRTLNGTVTGVERRRLDDGSAVDQLTFTVDVPE